MIPSIDSTIENKIINIVSQTLSVSNISLGSNMENTLEWDSLNHLRILSAIESEFDCTFKLEEISEVRGVKDWINLISDLEFVLS